MLLQGLLATLALLPVYLALRHPYRRLPLQLDTGYYVPNLVVAGHGLACSRGWHARFAWGSRMLPELFYSLIYLLYEGAEYPSKSRLWVSVWNYVTAILVGLLAWQVLGGGVTSYGLGLLIYALISSEPHYGTYHENAETFELPGQVLAVSFLTIGLGHGSGWWCGLAAFVWAAASFAGNLGALVGLVVLILSVRYSQPQLTGVALLGGAVAALAFLAWLGLLGKGLKTTVIQLWTRTTSRRPTALLRGWARRVVGQVGALVSAFAQRPIVPGAALVGLLFVPDLPAELGWYLAAVTLVYAVRGDGGRQALIPYWPLLAVLATRSVQWLSEGPAGVAVAAVLGAAWCVRVGLRGYRVAPGVLSDWSCPDVRTARAADRCRALLESASALRKTCGERSLLVYGPFSQAYVLADAAFPTSIIVPSHRLDALHPRWQDRLCERLVSSSPGLVLDTDRCFDAAAVRTRLGRDYELRRILPGDFRLYGLCNSNAAEAPVKLCDSFAPQTPAQRHLEECRMMLRRACGGNVRARSWAVLAHESNVDGARDVARRVGLPLGVCTDDPQEVLDRLGGADVLVVLDRPSDVWLARLEAAAGYRLIYTAGQFDHRPADDLQSALATPVPHVAEEPSSPTGVDAPTANRVPVATFG